MRQAAGVMLKLLLQGQTNFLRAIWKFNRVYNADRQFADHQREVRYAIRRPEAAVASKPAPTALYVHARPRREQAERAAAAAR